MSAWKATLNCSWNLKQVFLKATLLFWQLSIDSMLLLLSLSSTEKQEAQNQFGQGVGVGGSWQRSPLFPTVGFGPHEAIRDHSELGLSILLCCACKHFLDIQRNSSVHVEFLDVS